jgi:hypothetical protein
MLSDARTFLRSSPAKGSAAIIRVSPAKGSFVVVCLFAFLKCPGLALSCLVLPCLVLPCLVLSCLVLSRLVLSCRVLSCRVLSCRILSCLVLSCLVLSCCCCRSMFRALSMTNQSLCFIVSRLPLSSGISPSQVYYSIAVRLMFFSGFGHVRFCDLTFGSTPYSKLKRRKMGTRSTTALTDRF